MRERSRGGGGRRHRTWIAFLVVAPKASCLGYHRWVKGKGFSPAGAEEETNQREVWADRGEERLRLDDMTEQRGDPGDKERNPAGWASGMGTMGEYMVLAFVFPMALVLGFFVGRWIGGWFGGPLVGAITGLLLGTVAAFYNLWQTLKRLERRDAERQAEAETDD